MTFFLFDNYIFLIFKISIKQSGVELLVIEHFLCKDSYEKLLFSKLEICHEFKIILILKELQLKLLTQHFNK